jgi:hypothetical protein
LPVCGNEEESLTYLTKCMMMRRREIMKKVFASILAAAAITLFVQTAFGGNVTDLGNGIFKVYVDSKEINTSFAAYPDRNPPFLNKKTIDIKAKKGCVLVKLNVIIDNITDRKQPFKVGDIQLQSGGKKLSVVAVGLSDHPFIIKDSSYEKEKNVIEMVESRKDATGGSYRFPIYIFEAPKNSKTFTICYKGVKWFELDKIKMNKQ